MELNPTQKDLVLKIAELLCSNDITDGRAKYWVDRAAKLFPGSPSIFRLKVIFFCIRGCSMTSLYNLQAFSVFWGLTDCMLLKSNSCFDYNIFIDSCKVAAGNK